MSNTKVRDDIKRRHDDWRTAVARGFTVHDLLNMPKAELVEELERAVYDRHALVSEIERG